MLETASHVSREHDRIDDEFRLMDVSDKCWRAVSKPLALTKNIVDLWQIDLESGTVEIESHFKLLSDIEKERAARFVFARDKDRFIVGRGALRKILSGYLDITPEKIRFSTGTYGKPFLAVGGKWLRFNVSHSRAVAVIAVSLSREVGIDIEYVDTTFDVFSVASGVFTAAGVSRLRSLPSNLQASAFFTGWTRKEAILKATGDGLSGSEEVQAAILSINDEEPSIRIIANIKNTRWSLVSIRILKDFKAALAVEGNIEAIRSWRLPQLEMASCRGHRVMTLFNGSAPACSSTREVSL